MIEETADQPEITRRVWPENLWLSIWFSPRKTIRQIVYTDPKRYFNYLAFLFGVAGSLGKLSDRNAGDLMSLLWIFAIVLTLGGLGGFISIYFYGAITEWVGSLFGGVARSKDVRAAILWSNLPVMISYILWIPLILFYGEEMFTSITPQIDQSPFLLLFSGLIQLVLGIWSIILYVICLSEVHKFSIWRSIATILLPVLAIIILGGGCYLLTLSANGA